MLKFKVVGVPGASAGPIPPARLGPTSGTSGPRATGGCVARPRTRGFGWSIHESYGACRAGLNKKSGWPLDFLVQSLRLPP